MKISVCMASYNGDRWIFEQISSILEQISSDDELIIVDDFSTDNTVSVIKSFNDSRIKLFTNENNMGFVFTFEKAISLANNEIIFISDQDDIWMPGRLLLMVEKLQKFKVHLISSEFEIFGEIDKFSKYPLKMVEKKDSFNYYKMILRIFCGRSPYYGCTMAFHKNIKRLILPFPSMTESHDMWIALAGNLLESSYHFNYISLKRRIHGNNLTDHHRNLGAKVKSRFTFFFSLILLKIRMYKYRTELKFE